MSQRYLGGVITANPTTPTLASASGVWTLEQQFQYSQTIQPKIVGNSVRLRSSASAYFSRTPASASNRKTWTWSGWVKRGTLGVLTTLFGINVVNNDSQAFAIYFGSDNTLGVLPWSNSVFISSAVFRDPSAWYHIVVAFDSTQATATNRVKLYVNGVNQSGTYPLAVTLNADYGINQAGQHRLGDFPASGFGTFDGYLTEVNFIDGQALTPSSFGAYDSTGVWQPLGYTGTYGTNGFYLNFSDNSAATATTIGKDYSGNGNNWTPNNISVTSGVTYDSMIDSPTNYSDGSAYGVGNYAVMNPLDSGASFTPSDGNLRIVLGSSLARTTRSTMGVSSGKWYFETVVGGSGAMVGVATASAALSNYTGSDANGWSYYGVDGNKYTGGVNTAYGSTYTTNDVIGVALDIDSGKVWFSKNGTWQASGDPAAGTNAAYTTVSGVIFPVLSYANTGGTSHANFGQRPFTYTPPTGFKALNTANLPASNIPNGAQYMAATTYTGNGTAGRAITGLSFQPDLIWLKERSGANAHQLTDSVRGALKGLNSNLTDAENTYDAVRSFTSDGYTLGTSATANSNGSTYVAWQWKAGGTAVSNTSGSITSSVSANPTAGFSIATYTGTGALATVGHGLGVAPSMVIIKSRSQVANWTVYHSSVGNTGALFLNLTNATDTGSAYWNNTSPTSSVFTINLGSASNTSGQTYVAYCFAAVKGYAAFGRYTGNGSTDGPFVYLGFRPRFVLLKISSTTGDWVIYDTSRNTYNVVALYLYPNSSAAEGGSGTPRLDILSNGFKLRQAGQDNTASATYIYAAFAENPFNTSRAR